MNRIPKVAWCIGLAGISVLAGTHFVRAKAPATPVVVTFLSGDVSAAPQPLGGPFTATMDFLKYIPYICADSPAGGEELLRFLQTKNPITYTSLAVKVSVDPLYNRLDFKATIDGVSYTVTMNAFRGGTGITSTPTLDTIDLCKGRFAIIKDPPKGPPKLAVVAGPIATTDFTMTK